MIAYDIPDDSRNLNPPDDYDGGDLRDGDYEDGELSGEDMSWLDGPKEESGP